MRELIQLLLDGEVAFVVIEGMSAVLHGSSYVTADLGICYKRSSNNFEKLAFALQPIAPSLRDAPDGLPFVFDATTLQLGLNFTLSTDVGDIDLLGEVAGVDQFEQAIENAVQIDFNDGVVWTLSLNDLIAAKEAAGREKDLQLLPELRALQALQTESEE